MVLKKERENNHPFLRAVPAAGNIINQGEQEEEVDESRVHSNRTGQIQSPHSLLLTTVSAGK